MNLPSRCRAGSPAGARPAVAHHDRPRAGREDPGRPRQCADHRPQHRPTHRQSPHRIDSLRHRLVPDQRLHPVRVPVQRHEPCAEGGTQNDRRVASPPPEWLWASTARPWWPAPKMPDRKSPELQSTASAPAAPRWNRNPRMIPVPRMTSVVASRRTISATSRDSSPAARCMGSAHNRARNPSRRSALMPTIPLSTLTSPPTAPPVARCGTALLARYRCDRVTEDDLEGEQESHGQQQRMDDRHGVANHIGSAAAG